MAFFVLCFCEASKGILACFFNSDLTCPCFTCLRYCTGFRRLPPKDDVLNNLALSDVNLQVSFRIMPPAGHHGNYIEKCEKKTRSSCFNNRLLKMNIQLYLRVWS